MVSKYNFFISYRRVDRAQYACDTTDRYLSKGGN